MKKVEKIMSVLFIVMLIGSVLSKTPLAKAEFTLDIDASCEEGELSLDFILGTQEPIMWSTSLIIMCPIIQRVRLWTVPLPVIDPVIDLPIAFPFPSWWLIWITTGFYTETGAQVIDYELVDTGDDIQTQSNLPDTGIDLCFDDQVLIPCPAPGGSFYGQDAQYVTSPMSFADNGDGTVTDYVTGLMWQQENDDEIRDSWIAADYCKNFELAGHTDWRLPGEYELQGLIDYGRYDPAIDTIYFPGTNPSYYWSSVLSARYSVAAWYVQFYDGYIGNETRTQDYYVRCVRGETRTPSFTDHGDGTVTDNVTGLMWQQENDDVGMDWWAALAYCESFDLAGHMDWRLPDIKELRSIVDNNRYDPAIDTTYFPGTYAEYWSSSTNANNAENAWNVSFYAGRNPSYGKQYHKYVRCVR